MFQIALSSFSSASSQCCRRSFVFRFVTCCLLHSLYTCGVVVAVHTKRRSASIPQPSVSRRLEGDPPPTAQQAVLGRPTRRRPSSSCASVLAKLSSRKLIVRIMTSMGKKSAPVFRLTFVVLRERATATAPLTWGRCVFCSSTTVPTSPILVNWSFEGIFISYLIIAHHRVRTSFSIISVATIIFISDNSRARHHRRQYLAFIVYFFCLIASIAAFCASAAMAIHQCCRWTAETRSHSVVYRVSSSSSRFRSLCLCGHQSIIFHTSISIHIYLFLSFSYSLYSGVWRPRQSNLRPTLMFDPHHEALGPWPPFHESNAI